MKISKINYKGWPNCYLLSNGSIDLIVTTDVGPRIIFFGFTGGENEFFEREEQHGLTGGSEWRMYGGHRFWHAPEDPVRTYAPDNQPVQVEQLENGIRLTADPEPTGIQKVIEIRISADQPCVKVKHELHNKGLWTVQLAPWALSVMKAGGMAIIPQPENIDFPAKLTPTHSMALWSYTKLNDPRWTWGEKYIYLRQDSSAAKPQKVGMFNPCGWAAYSRQDHLFIKKFDSDPTRTYPDLNCNFETFTNFEMLELETLGALVYLEPGKKVEHDETWSLHQGIKLSGKEEQIDREVLPLLKTGF